MQGAAEAEPPADGQITFLYVTDLEAGTDFYGRVLGLPLVLDQGTCRIFRVTGSSFLGICSRTDRPASPTGIVVTIVTDRVDDWYTLLASRGARFEHPPSYNEEYQIYHAFTADPDGHLIEIQEFRDPRWAG